MTAPDSIEQVITGRLRDVPDFPTPGVTFKDITPLLADGKAFGEVVAELARRHGEGIDLVAGIEARGFILGAALATHLGIGFVPVRKAGKLPGDVISTDYALEYGTATIEIQHDAVPQGARVLVIDDVLATGGTAVAACDLIERGGGEVTAFAVLVELGFLSGRERLASRQVDSLLIL